MAFDFNDIQIHDRTNLDELEDDVVLHTAKNMFYAANDSFIQKQYGFYNDFCLDFANDVLDFQVINAPTGRRLSINLAESYITYFASSKVMAVTYILIRTLIANLEFFKSMFPDGIWTKNVIVGTSRYQYSYIDLPVGSCSVLPLEVNQDTMKALQWLSTCFNTLDGNIQLVLTILFLHDDLMTGFKYIYNFLAELRRFDRDRYITLGKDMFISMLYAYQRYNKCNIQDIIAKVNYRNVSVVPAREALNYLIQINHLEK